MRRSRRPSDLDIIGQPMGAGLEREIKLRYGSAAEARQAIRATGAILRQARRLQDDRLLDSGTTLRAIRSVLRVRTEAGRCRLTFKGPPQPSTMKLREELETDVHDGDVLLALLARLGFQVWFRYQKYREEYARGDVIVALDETPIGTFVELEGSEAGITMLAEALGRGQDEYILDSYRGLFVRACQATGAPGTDMLFDAP
jgi:adenylate cyclase class 2